MLAEALSIGLLLAVLVCAVVRPWGWPEAMVAVPAAVVIVAVGAISLDVVRDELERLRARREGESVPPPAVADVSVTIDAGPR